MANCKNLITLTLLLALGVPGQLIAEETVVLLHGLSRSSTSMAKMEKALQQEGYRTCNINYPSTRHTVEALASDHVVTAIRQCTSENETLHFVTHSMGGIVVRQIRLSEPDLVFGRVVMLGPPNRGSELVDRMKNWKLFKWLNGPAGQQLGTEQTSLPNRLGDATFEVGVIAGNKPFLEPFRRYIPGDSDGKVSTDSTMLNGMKDHLILAVTHATMMRNKDVIQQSLHFLKAGTFDKVPQPPPSDTALP